MFEISCKDGAIQPKRASYHQQEAKAHSIHWPGSVSVTSVILSAFWFAPTPLHQALNPHRLEVSYQLPPPSWLYKVLKVRPHNHGPECVSVSVSVSVTVLVIVIVSVTLPFPPPSWVGAVWLVACRYTRNTGKHLRPSHWLFFFFIKHFWCFFVFSQSFSKLDQLWTTAADSTLYSIWVAELNPTSFQPNLFTLIRLPIYRRKRRSKWGMGQEILLTLNILNIFTNNS